MGGVRILWGTRSCGRGASMLDSDAGGWRWGSGGESYLERFPHQSARTSPSLPPRASKPGQSRLDERIETVPNVA